MKKLLYIFLLLSILALTACSGSENDTDIKEPTVKESLTEDTADISSTEGDRTQTESNPTTPSNGSETVATSSPKETDEPEISGIISDDPIENNFFFKTNSNGYVIGAPGDYKDLIFDLNGVSISAADYFGNGYGEAVERWYSILRPYSVNEVHNTEEYFSISLDDKDFQHQLEMEVYSDQIIYGSFEETPDFIEEIKFSVNGVFVGDSEEKICEVLGKDGMSFSEDVFGSKYYSYDFESGGFLTFRCYNGIISYFNIALSH